MTLKGQMFLVFTSQPFAIEFLTLECIKRLVKPWAGNLKIGSDGTPDLQGYIGVINVIFMQYFLEWFKVTYNNSLGIGTS